MGKTFIFDLDDTLVYNQYLHYRSEIRWLVYAVERFYSDDKELCDIINTVSHQLVIDGFHAKAPLQYLLVYGEEKTKPIIEILDCMARIDIASVELAKERNQNAFSSNRYPTSLVKTFRHFSEKFNVPFTEEDTQEVYKIGKLAFDVEAATMPGAREVLDFLKEKKQEILLFTKGDEEVQHKKLEMNNMTQYFSEVHVVHNKNPSILRSIVGTRKKENCYMVGNSFKSDILPALDISLHAIFIPKETWKYEEDYTEMKLDVDLMIHMERISQITEEFHRL